MKKTLFLFMTTMMGISSFAQTPDPNKGTPILGGYLWNWADGGKTAECSFDFFCQRMEDDEYVSSGLITTLYISAYPVTIQASGDTVQTGNQDYVAIDTAEIGSSSTSNHVVMKNKFILNQMYVFQIQLINDSGSIAWRETRISENGFPLAISNASNTTAEIQLFPNPCTNNLNITVQDERMVKMVNIAGQVVLLQELHAGVNRIATDNIPSGIYLATLTDSKGRATTQRILKE